MFLFNKYLIQIIKQERGLFEDGVERKYLELEHWLGKYGQHNKSYQ